MRLGAGGNIKPPFIKHIGTEHYNDIHALKYADEEIFGVIIAQAGILAANTAGGKIAAIVDDFISRSCP